MNARSRQCCWPEALPFRDELCASNACNAVPSRTACIKRSLRSTKCQPFRRSSQARVADFAAAVLRGPLVVPALSRALQALCYGGHEHPPATERNDPDPPRIRVAFRKQKKAVRKHHAARDKVAVGVLRLPRHGRIVAPAADGHPAQT